MVEDTTNRQTFAGMEQETEPSSPFLRVCRGLPVQHTPVWFMRQAGRYMSSIQALLEKRSLQNLMEIPELAAQVTMQPVVAFGTDAAILFSDFLPPLSAMGLRVNVAGASGPTIENPVRRNYDIDILATPPAEEHLSYVLDAVRLASGELHARGVPLIGFGGAPFTLATYAIEGDASRDFANTKALMYREPAAWKRLMTKLVTVQADFLTKQVRAGASALQVFDSWAGLALSRDDYRRYVLPYNRALFERLEATGVPVINFCTGCAPYVADVASAGGDVVSVDWRMPLDWYWQQIGYSHPIQGNLDPVALLAPWRELEYRANRVLREAQGTQGHIFNLGHGILPGTPEENVNRLVDYVHERTSRADN